MSKSFKEDVAAYFNERSLSEAQLNSLCSIKKPQAAIYKNKKVMVYIAASVMMFFSFFSLLSGKTMAEKIAYEVVYNHNKQLESEFTGASISNLQVKLDRLDFLLTESHHSILADLNLTGGRYCSIGGRLAAQLQLRDQSGGRYTLYQVPLKEGWGVDTLHNVTMEKDGVVVRLWVEKGLLFAVAGAR